MSENGNNEKKDFFDEELDKELQKSQGSKPGGYNAGISQRNSTAEENAQWKKFSDAEKKSRVASKKNKPVIVVASVLIMVVALVFAISCVGNISFSLGLLDEVLQIMDIYYLYDYNADALLQNAYDGFSAGLDPYTFIMDPYEYYELMHAEDEGTYFGISYKNSENPDASGVEIHSVVLDSPADCAISEDGKYAGLRAGDIIVSVNGISVKGYTATQLNEMMSDFTSAAITVNRNGTVISFGSIERDNLTNRYVEYFYMDETGEVRTNMKYYYNDGSTVYTNLPYVEGTDGQGIINMNDPDIYPHYDAYSLQNIDSGLIGYVKLHEFSYTTAENVSHTTIDFSAAMNVFRDSYGGEGKLVLDLNGNPGGYNDYCQSVASYFIYNGTPGEELEVCNLRMKDDSNVETYKVKSKYADYFDENAEEPQIFVLTNNNSASASEMLTGAILVYETGVQIGLQTYGKGISQTIIAVGDPVTIVYKGQKVSSSYAFYFTFAKFYTPNVPGSQSPYNNYCNQSDLNGNGVIDENETKRGFAPLPENEFGTLYDQMLRVNELCGG